MNDKSNENGLEVHKLGLNDFSLFNLNLQKADLEGINDKLMEVDWKELAGLCQPDEDGSLFAELIRLTVLQVCYIHAPIKEAQIIDKRPKVSRTRRILHRKRRKLKGRLKCIKNSNPSSQSIVKLENDLSLLTLGDIFTGN